MKATPKEIEQLKREINVDGVRTATDPKRNYKISTEMKK